MRLGASGRTGAGVEPAIGIRFPSDSGHPRLLGLVSRHVSLGGRSASNDSPGPGARLTLMELGRVASGQRFGAAESRGAMPGKLIGSLSLDSGTAFEAVVYDLLFERTDAIVNAANGGLSHGGGVAAAIADAAGPVLVDEGNQIIRKLGRVPVGSAVKTSAGKLPFKAVIHAVGPRLGDGDEGRKIISALHAAFALADADGCKSISFPAISSGIFAVPFAVCARAYVDAVRTYFVSARGSSIAQVRLCVYDGPIVNEIARVLRS